MDTNNRSLSLPASYPKAIIQADLIPKELPDKEPTERLRAAVAYLRRYREAFRSDNSNVLEPLSSFKINSPDNIPVAIPNQGSSDWNIWNVVDRFLIEFDTGKTSVVIDSSVDNGFMATGNIVIFDNRLLPK